MGSASPPPRELQGPPKPCPPQFWPCHLAPWHFPSVPGWWVCFGGQSSEPPPSAGAGGLGCAGEFGVPRGLAAPSSPLWGHPALVCSAAKPVDNKTIHLPPALGPRCAGGVRWAWGGTEGFWGERGAFWNREALAGEEELEGMCWYGVGGSCCHPQGPTPTQKRDFWLCRGDHPGTQRYQGRFTWPGCLGPLVKGSGGGGGRTLQHPKKPPTPQKTS